MNKKQLNNNFKILQDLHFNKYDEGFNYCNFSDNEKIKYTEIVNGLIREGLQDFYFITEDLKNFLESYGVILQFDYTDDFNNNYYILEYQAA